MSGGISDEGSGEDIPVKRAVMETGFLRVRDARLALGGLLVLSMTANLALGIGLAGREAVTVLVPSVTGPAWEVGGGRAGARYLEDMARTAAVTLLTLTPENAARHCHVNSVAFGTAGALASLDVQDILPSSPLSTGHHPACCLALLPFHAELSGR